MDSIEAVVTNRTSAKALADGLRDGIRTMAARYGFDYHDRLEWLVADKIDELITQNEKLKAAAVNWHKITTRQLTDEEKEWYAGQGYEFIYDCDMPEDGQEILIATPWGTDKDTCSNSAEYGIGLEGHDDFDNVLAWAELPQYKEEDNG